jgi:hypothetical protein
MTVVSLKCDERNPAKSEEQLMMELRLHEQILSCMDFVIEKVMEIYPGDITIEKLNAGRDDLSRKRKQLMDQISANGNSRSRT